MGQPYRLVAEFESGRLRTHELNAELAATWSQLLQDGEVRGRIADILGTEISLDPASVPVSFKVRKSGTGGADLALMIGAWIATDILLAAFKDLAKEELKRRIKQLWGEVLQPALRKRWPAQKDALGKDKTDEDQGG